MARRATTLTLVSGIALTGCATAEVKFSAAPTGADAIKAASSHAVEFRVPRSQISISFGDPKSIYTSSVLDVIPVDKATPALLPQTGAPAPQEAVLYYSLSVTSPDPTSVSLSSFLQAGKDNYVKVFPVPTCVVATVDLYVKLNQGSPAPSSIAFTSKAVPTELSLPSTAGVPAINNSPIYIAYPKDDWISTTALTATYIDNTKIVSKLGSTVTDNTTTTLQSVTALAVAAAPLALALAPPAPPPAATGSPAFFNVGESTLTVASNTNVDPAPIPNSGSITMNSTCGASTSDTTSSNANLNTTLQNLSKDVSDVQQIYNAWKNTKK